MKNIRKHSFILLLLTIGILFFVLKDNFSEIVSVLLQTNIWYILVSILLIVLYWLFKAISKYFIVKEYSEKIKFKTILKQTIITKFFNGVTPFSSGGQPMEIYMLKKSGISLAKSTNIILQNFLVYQVVLVLYGIFAIIMNYKFNYFESVPFLRKLVFLGFFINALVCVVTCIICFWKKASKGIVDFILKIVIKLKLIKDVDKITEKINKKVTDFQESADFLLKRKKTVLKSLFANLLGLTVFYSIPLFILMGMGNTFSMNLLSVITSSAYVLLIGSFVPVPGGTGGIEFGFMKFFGTFINGSALSALLLVWRFVTYYFGIIVGGITFSFYKGDE